MDHRDGIVIYQTSITRIATLFTTHATSIGRSIAGNNKPLYDYMKGYHGDQMAQELNMVSKHSVEKHAAPTSRLFYDCQRYHGTRMYTTPGTYSRCRNS